MKTFFFIQPEFSGFTVEKYTLFHHLKPVYPGAQPKENEGQGILSSIVNLFGWKYFSEGYLISHPKTNFEVVGISLIYVALLSPYSWIISCTRSTLVVLKWCKLCSSLIPIRKGFKNVSPRSARDVKWPEMLDIWMDIKYYICKLLYVWTQCIKSWAGSYWSAGSLYIIQHIKPNTFHYQP